MTPDGNDDLSRQGAEVALNERFELLPQQGMQAELKGFVLVAIVLAVILAWLDHEAHSISSVCSAGVVCIALRRFGNPISLPLEIFFLKMY
jgi:hypothetical protein